MTTEDSESTERLDQLNANLAKIEELSQRLMVALSKRKPVDPALNGPGNEVYLKAAAAYVAEMMQNPAKMLEHQITYWGKTLKHYVEAQQALAKGTLEAPPDSTPKDRRFANPLWETHPFFNYLKQQYLLNSEAVSQAVAGIDNLDPADRRRVEYFTRQFIDLFAPSNFLGTNPDALTRAVETNGRSLVQGLENLVRDIESSDGELLVSLADRNAFVLGENIATTKGSVVFRNRMLELIQYAPTTEKVHKTPLLIFPPWINKFYILDLKAQNSLVKWIVDQGYTLFIVSWVNPDPSYRETGMDDYIREGYLTAMDQVRQITGEKKINVVGYCIAGTTLALTLAYLQKTGVTDINCATFFTTLTDFSEPGEVGVFLSDDFVNGIERQIEADGIMSKLFMGRTFSYLRSNDLVYQPAIRSYMLGEPPPAFDLLYWNGDGTNLPGKMAVEYLRGLCQLNNFAVAGFAVLGHKVTLKDVALPICAIACETDHIAPWKSSYAGIRQFGSVDKTFVLSESGHIAGIVNPPSKVKYGHYMHDGPLDADADAWKKEATFHKGSWWPVWEKWLAGHSGPMVKARQVGDSRHPELAPAPGTYVSQIPSD